MGNPASEAVQIVNMRIIIAICSMVSCVHSLLYSNTCDKQKLDRSETAILS